MTDSTPSADAASRRLVWDGPVRLTHWLLTLSVAGSYITHKLGPAEFHWHRRFGYLTLVLVTVRILWGFVGTRHARFASFVRGPASVFRYLTAWLGGTFARYPGHNPAGGWMVVVLLALLAAQATTGLFANDEIASTGPLYGYVLNATSNRLTGWHHRLFDALLILITIHIVAVLLYLGVRRANLVGPMLSGYKRGSEVELRDAVTNSRWLLWFALLAATGGLLAWIIARAPVAELWVF